MESLNSRKSIPSVKVSLAYSETEYNIPATAILEGVKFYSTYSLQTECASVLYNADCLGLAMILVRRLKLTTETNSPQSYSILCLRLCKYKGATHRPSILRPVSKSKCLYCF